MDDGAENARRNSKIEGEAVALVKSEDKRLSLPRRPPHSLSRQWFLTQYRMRSFMRRHGSLRILVAHALSLLGACLPMLAAGWKHGLPFTFMYVGAKWVRSFNEDHPDNTKRNTRNYLRRALALNTMIQELQRWPDLAREPKLVLRFQEDALRLVVDYVRSYFRDDAGKVIYANLLVEDGDEMLVVARDTDHRGQSARTPKHFTIAYVALTRGAAEFTGHVYQEFPDTPTGKKYQSILVIPVRVDGELLGVVSIDSSKPYQFDDRFTDLVECITPYVGLVGWTLRLRRQQMASGREGRAHE